MVEVVQPGDGGGGVESVGSIPPITSTGGTTPVISTSMSTNKLIGRGTAGTGVMEEITIGTNLSLSGTTLNATGGGGGIAIGNPVTSGTPGDILYVDSGGNLGQILGFDNAHSATYLGTSAGGTSLSFNTGIGYQALKANVSGVYSTALGAGTLQANTSGYYNTAVGAQSLLTNIDGHENVGVGLNSLVANTGGYRNVAVGTFALSSNDGGIENTGIGYNVMANNTSGSQNTAVGIGALQANVSGSNNTAVGYNTLNKNTGNYNLAFGSGVLTNNVTGISNTGVGFNALTTNTGSNNTGIGFQSLINNSSGTDNTAVGFNSLVNVNTGTANTGFGESAGFTATSSSGGVFLGYQAGYYETGSNKLFIDNAQRASEADARLKALIYGVFASTVAGQSITFNADANITGAVKNYKNIATTGNGVPSIYGSGRSTAQTAAVASVAAYTVGASDGSFIVSANANVTTFVAGTFNITVAYTDETNTAQTLKLNFSSVTGTLGIALAGAGPFEGIPVHIRCKASTAITIATAGTFTSLTYNVEGAIQQII